MRTCVHAFAATCVHAFAAGESEGAFTRGSQWLVWKFESDSTLGDALDGNLGAFPQCLEDIMVRGKVKEDAPEDKRAIAVGAAHSGRQCTQQAPVHTASVSAQGRQERLCST